MAKIRVLPAILVGCAIGAACLFWKGTVTSNSKNNYLTKETKEMVQKDNDELREDFLSKDFVVVDFYADWCGPCRMIMPFLEEIQAETGIDIVRVNIDENPDIASKYNVMSIPTLIIFKKGEKVSVQVGGASKARLLEWIQSHQ